MTATAKSAANTGTRAGKTPHLTRTQRTTILKALADPKRFELLERIARSSCPVGCGEALEALAIAPVMLSHHIKELQTSGLIDVRREGKFAFLSIRPGVLEAIAASLSSLSPTSCAWALSTCGDSPDRRFQLQGVFDTSHFRARELQLIDSPSSVPKPNLVIALAALLVVDPVSIHMRDAILKSAGSLPLFRRKVSTSVMAGFPCRISLRHSHAAGA